MSEVQNFSDSVNFRVKHFAEPPAFRNSDKSTSRILKPTFINLLFSVLEALFNIMTLPILMALHAKFLASMVLTIILLWRGILSSIANLDSELNAGG